MAFGFSKRTTLQEWIHAGGLPADYITSLCPNKIGEVGSQRLQENVCTSFINEFSHDQALFQTRGSEDLHGVHRRPNQRIGHIVHADDSPKGHQPQHQNRQNRVHGLLQIGEKEGCSH